jgi:hypothetical protein
VCQPRSASFFSDGARREGRERIRRCEVNEAYVRLISATGVYGMFMAVFLLLRHGFPQGIAPAVIASVIYISLVSVFLRKQTA